MPLHVARRQASADSRKPYVFPFREYRREVASPSRVNTERQRARICVECVSAPAIRESGSSRLKLSSFKCRASSISGFEGSSGAGAKPEETADSDGGVAEFSSSLGQRQRSHIIRRARSGFVRVIVCSDGMARGMDLEGVGLVVNYDVPSQAKTYVHR